MAAPIAVAETGDEGRVRFVCVDRDAEDRREGREGSVDQAHHRRLHLLQQEVLFGRTWVDYKHRMTSD